MRAGTWAAGVYTRRKTNRESRMETKEGVDIYPDLGRGHVCKLHVEEYATADEGRAGYEPSVLCHQHIQCRLQGCGRRRSKECNGKTVQKENKHRASELKGPE